MLEVRNKHVQLKYQFQNPRDVIQKRCLGQYLQAVSQKDNKQAYHTLSKKCY